MEGNYKIEIFSAGCILCKETIRIVNQRASSASEITIHNMHDQTVAARAAELEIDSLPAVVIDGIVTKLS